MKTSRLLRRLAKAWLFAPRCNASSASLKVAAIFGLFAFNAFGGTYYIDFSNGSDSNNGSRTSPWKLHPYMRGWAGSYNHAAGDRFIFKGGVTWPASAMPLNIDGGNGGSSLSTQDYYGVDATWYQGTFWSRPIFDGQSSSSQLIRIGRASYITIDNFDIRGLKGANNYGDCSIKMDYATYVTISNCWVHKWVADPSMTTDGQIGGIYHYLGSPNTGVTVTHCDVGNNDGDGNSGTCLYYIDTIEFTKIHNAPEGILHGGRMIHDNDIYDIKGSFDPTLHCNVTFIDNFGNDSYFYNNYIHGDNSRAMLLYLVGFDRASANWWVYNNVILSTNLVTITLDTDNHACAMNAYFYNNTVLQAQGGQLTCTSRGSGSYNVVEIKNNHWIGSAPSPGGVGQLTMENNYVSASIANAVSLGYSAVNNFGPSSSSSPTVGAGANLASKALPGLTSDTSRGGYRAPLPRSTAGAWSIGAYEFSASNPTSTPIISVSPGSLAFGSIQAGTTTNLTLTVRNIGSGTLSGNATVSAPFQVVSGGSYNLASNASQTINIRYAPQSARTDNQTVVLTGGGGGNVPVTGSAWAVQVGLSFSADSGTISGPFTLSAGSISQSVTTTTTDSGGQALYNFTITNTGSYAIQTQVNAPDDGANSFFVSIDGQPTDPLTIWDIPVTVGIEDRFVSWRGNGTPDDNQFLPKVFNLTAGTHQLVIRGREANTQLQGIAIVPLPPAPQNLRVVFGP